MATRNTQLPYDPMIDVIGADIKVNRNLQNAVKRLPPCIVAYRNTVHVSDELLEAWYRFKENQLCQP